MAVQVFQPFEIFYDINGRPLDDGFIFIGQPNLDPVTNPISVFFDEALTIPAAQPIRTRNGFPANAGVQAQVFVAETTFSISIKNKNSTVIRSVAAVHSSTDLEGRLRDTTNPNGAGIVGYLPEANAEASTAFEELRRFALYPKQYDNGVRTVAQYLQLAIDRGVATGRPVCIDETYDVDFPIYIPAGAHLFGTGRIRNTFSGSPNINKLAIVPGNYNPSEFAGLSYFGCNAAAAGQRYVDATTPADAANFAAGDIVFVRSVRFYTGSGAVTLPLYGSFNKVLSVNATTGIIELEFPILDAVSDPQIAKANTATLDIFGLRTLYVCYGARIDGVSIESVHGNALERGGFLNCDFWFPEIRGLTGIFTNGVCFSRVNVGSIVCDRKPFDLAGCSTGSRLNIETIAFRKTANSANEPLFALNENALHNYITVGSFSADEFDFASQNLIQIGAAGKNTLHIQTLCASSLVGSPVVFDNVLRSGGGQTQSATENNTVVIDDFQGGATLQRFAFFINAGSQNRSNTIKIGNASGTVSTSLATVAGDNHTVHGNFTNGSISVGSATNLFADIATPGGIIGFSRTAGHNIRLNGTDFVDAPRIQSGVVHAPATINGGGGAASYTPDLANGGVHKITFTSSTAFTVNNPTNIAVGDTLEIEIKNSNGATAITPAFGANFVGGSVTSITAGNSSFFSFRMTATGRILRTEEIANFTG